MTIKCIRAPFSVDIGIEGIVMGLRYGCVEMDESLTKFQRIDCRPEAICEQQTDTDSSPCLDCVWTEMRCCRKSPQLELRTGRHPLLVSLLGIFDPFHQGRV